jgi:hypothetical protein
MLMLVATLLGAVLGIRFQIFAVIPVFILAASVSGLGWLFAAAPTDMPFVQLLLLGISLQLGYLLGAAFRFCAIYVPVPRDSRVRRRGS